MNNVDQELQSVTAAIQEDMRGLRATVNTQVNSYITQKLAHIDLNSLLSGAIDRKLADLVNSKSFPAQSIPQSAVNFTGLELRGDHIKGGIIEKFGSTGIEDLASGVQMTLMDQATAFEGPVWAPEFKATGNVTVGGKLIISGEIDDTAPGFDKFVEATSAAVRNSLDQNLFASYSSIIFDKIRKEGIALDKITQDGKEVVVGNKLGYHIVDTNIQRLGMVKDLQTQGENYLSQTLYVTKGRIGVNTMDPSAVLSVWDEEVEISLGKYSQNTGSINTPRNQTLVLGANGKNNLTLNTDGSVEVESLTIGSVLMTSAVTIPNYSGITGQIVWNQAPHPGAAIGWVCLGGNRWAKFGIIE
jgi:hypothetical protein